MGRVRGRSLPGPEFSFLIDGEQKPAAEVLKDSVYAKRFIGDPEKIEHFVAVDWAQTVPLAQGMNEPGMFGNRNTVCAPKVEKWASIQPVCHGDASEGADPALPTESGVDGTDCLSSVKGYDT